jgi:HAD superfamily hydrolase (TIGR01549 family)
MEAMQFADMIEGPIRMVTFDLYDTLIEADPPGWVRFQKALQLSGFDVDMPEVMRAYTAGQQFFTLENGRQPIRERSPEQREQFQINITGVSLEALDLPTDNDTVNTVKRHFRDDTSAGNELEYRPYDEVNEVLDRLRKQRIITAVISNADEDVTRLCLQLGFSEQMDIIVTSALVGWEKPDARTFYAALEPFNMPASSVLHVGDQPDSDVLGARAIGMAAALLDRYDQYLGEPENAERVTSLTQLADLVINYNASFH